MMVAEAELTREERRALTRERLVVRALARGDHEMADVYRQMEFDDESTPEEDADDARVSAERRARITDWDTQREFNEELDELYADEDRLLSQLDEAFPHWETHIERLPEKYPEEVEYLRRIEQQLPNAAKILRDYREELRRG